LFSSHCFGDFIIIIKNGKKGLRDEENVLIPPTYEDIGWSEGGFQPVNGVIGYKQNGKWGLINLRNKIITASIYESLENIGDELLLASKIQDADRITYFGIINIKGKAQVGFQYQSIEKCSERYLVSVNKRSTKYYGILDSNERAVIEVAYRQYVKLSNGNLLLNDKDLGYQIINQAGIHTSSVAFDDIQLLGDYCQIKKDGKYQYSNLSETPLPKASFKKIDLVGNELITTLFPAWHIYRHSKKINVIESDSIYSIEKNWTTSLSNNFLRVTDLRDSTAEFSSYGRYLGGGYFITGYNESSVITKYNNQISIPHLFDTIFYKDPVFYAKRNNTWWFYDGYGSLVNTMGYHDVKPVTGAIIPVSRNGYWGFFNTNVPGRNNIKFDQVTPFKNNTSIAEYLDFKGLLNLTYDWVIPPEYNQLKKCFNLFLGQKNGTNYLIDNSNIIRYATSNDLRSNEAGFLEVSEGKKIGFISKNGGLILPPIYEGYKIIDNRVIGFYIDGRYRLFTIEGKSIPHAMEISDVVSASEEFIGVKIGKKYGFIDYLGRLRFANRYESVGAVSKEYAAVKIRSKWGFVDKIEQLKVQPVYDSVAFIQNKHSIVISDNKYGLVDMEGNEKLSTNYDSIFSANNNNNYIIIKNSKYGLTNRSGRIIFQPQYDWLETIGGGYIKIKVGNKFGIINDSGNVIVSPQYDQIYYDALNGLFFCKKLD